MKTGYVITTVIYIILAAITMIASSNSELPLDKYGFLAMSLSFIVGIISIILHELKIIQYQGWFVEKIQRKKVVFGAIIATILLPTIGYFIYMVAINYFQ